MLFQANESASSARPAARTLYGLRRRCLHQV